MNNIQLCIDFGLLVLIWIVQLVIYPSFKYYSTNNLKKWHKIYTNKIAIVVAPLMLTQLLFAAVQVFTALNFYSIFYAAGVLFLWGITFKLFVPLHFSINTNEYKYGTLKKLVLLNWIRTIVWTLIFILSVVFLPL